MAKVPASVKSVRKAYGFNTSNVFTTTNPKTTKNGTVSDRPTIVLHLEPVRGGVCAAAGSCASVCLHKSGNPLYFKAKLPRRTLRSDAWLERPDEFAVLLICEAARQRRKGYVGIRLNGTSDIAWENVVVGLLPSEVDYINSLAGRTVWNGPVVTTVIGAMIALGYQPYDYTKRIDRDFVAVRAMGYHLTLSWGGKHDDVVFDVAAANRLNVAAAVASRSLPDTIAGLPVVDGDLTDWRVDDPDGGHVVGLRLKRTDGATQSQQSRFCITA